MKNIFEHMDLLKKENRKSDFGAIQNPKFTETSKNGRFNTHKNSELLELLENACTDFLLGCSSCCIYFFFSLVWFPISSTRTYPPSAFMTVSSHFFLSPSRSATNNNSFFLSRSENAPPVHSFASHELSTAPPSWSMAISQGKTIYYEPPPTIHPRERILSKDFHFQPSCLPALPRRRVNKKGGITASFNQSEGQVFDLNKKTFYNKLAQSTLAVHLYYYLGGQVPYAISNFPRLIAIFTAIKTMDIFPYVEKAIAQKTMSNVEITAKALKKCDEGIVRYVPVLDSAMNIWKGKASNKINEERKMDNLIIDTKIQETLLSAMDKPGLILAVTQAKKRDIEGIKEKDGSLHRFTTIEKLWPSEQLKDVRIAFLEGNPTPLLSRIAATQFLCIWNSSLPISSGAAQSQQRILDYTFAFQTRMQNRFEDLVTFKKPVSQSEPFFTEFHIWGYSLPYLREKITKTEKELITTSFQKGCEKYQKNCGIQISATDLQNYIDQFIEKEFV